MVLWQCFKQCWICLNPKVQFSTDLCLQKHHPSRSSLFCSSPVAVAFNMSTSLHPVSNHLHTFSSVMLWSPFLSCIDCTSIYSSSSPSFQSLSFHISVSPHSAHSCPPIPPLLLHLWHVSTSIGYAQHIHLLILNSAYSIFES